MSKNGVFRVREFSIEANAVENDCGGDDVELVVRITLHTHHGGPSLGKNGPESNAKMERLVPAVLRTLADQAKFDGSASVAPTEDSYSWN
jgi:hypothetical protein